MLKITAICIAGAVMAVANGQDNGITERGIRLRKQPGNATYDIELTRGSKVALVPPDFRFQTGDRFALRVKVTTDSYIYVLNRTFVGNPDELRNTRQIRLVSSHLAQGATDSNSKTDISNAQYHLVYPVSGNRLVRAGLENIVPSADYQMEMDEHPGVEQLVLVVSRTPLTLASLFNSNGELKRVSSRGPTNDSASDVAERLRKQLSDIANNSEGEESSVTQRSITFVDLPSPHQLPPDSNSSVPPVPARGNPVPGGKSAPPSCVVVPKSVQQPFLTDIVLAHYPQAK